ncbi:MAG: hypothetical protein LBT21_07015 [Oscillospiraceae bacterium]|jgi:hypothetical protein|nr:hypothetical protein [Oscillospiraceae bacterium]
MANCTGCGTELNEGAAFCSICGTAAPAAAFPGAEAAPPPAAPDFPPAFQANDFAPPVFPSPEQTTPTAQPLPNYGAPVPPTAPLPNYGAQQQPGAPFAYAPQPAPDADAQDVQQNKLMAVLAYLGPLVFIPWFAAPKSKFARFHVTEGIKLLLAWAAYFVLRSLFYLIKFKRTIEVIWDYTYTERYVPGFIVVLFSIIAAVIGVFAILGIINALQGKKAKLPLLDKLTIPSTDGE